MYDEESFHVCIDIVAHLHNSYVVALCALATIEGLCNMVSRVSAFTQNLSNIVYCEASLHVENV